MAHRIFVAACRSFWLQCVGSSLWHVGFSLVVACRLLSSCDAQVPECMGSVVVACGLSSCGSLSSCGAWAPEHVGSVVVACGFSSCGTQA